MPNHTVQSSCYMYHIIHHCPFDVVRCLCAPRAAALQQLAAQLSGDVVNEELIRMTIVFMAFILGYVVEVC